MTKNELVDSKGTSSDEIDLIGVYHQCMSRKWFIVAIAALSTFIGSMYAQIKPNEYTSSALVQIEKRAENLALSRDMIGELLLGEKQASSFEAEIHVIKSRLILDQIVKEHGLDLIIEPLRPQFLGELYPKIATLWRNLPLSGIIPALPSHYPDARDSLQVGSHFQTENSNASYYIIEVLPEKKYEITSFDQTEKPIRSIHGTVGEDAILENDLRIKVDSIKASPGAQFRLRFVSIGAASAKLKQNLSISERGQRGGTGIVDFVYKGTDEDRVPNIVNSIVNEYQEQALARRSADLDQGIDFIKQQLPQAEKNLAVAITQLSNHLEANGAYSNLSVITQETIARAVDIESRLGELAFDKSQMSLIVTENHPDYQRIVAEELELNARLLKLREEIANLPQAEQKLVVLNKDVQAAQAIKDQLLSRLDQLEIIRASTVGSIRFLERAESAMLSGPNRTSSPILAGLLGIFLSIAIILIKNNARVGFEDSREIERLGLPIFATVPLVEGLKMSNAQDENYALARSNPEDLAVEALRGLRTGLHFTLSVNGAKTIAFTSSAPNEGKSFVSLNLAIVAAKAGSNVLLIDSDLRRGELHKPFGLSRKSTGLTNYLASETEFPSVIHHSKKLGLDFIPNGGYPPNPSELLSSRRLPELISAAEQKYDLVIFDCPPVLAVTDPSIVASKAGAVFLVVSHLRTTVEEVEACIKSLGANGVELKGAVVNSFDQTGGKYGSYATQYGYYGNAYRYDYRS